MMTQARIVGLLTVVAWMAIGGTAVEAGGRDRPRRLIEFGWDEPDTAFLRRHVEEMARTPFDGCVFHVNSVAPDGKVGRFTWECWSRRAFAEDEVKGALDDLRALPKDRFAHNFLRFNVTPADLDWFDDFDAIRQNARLAARLVREGRCAGVLFDTEQYEAKLWDYRKQRDVGSKSWDDYAAQVRRRGAEVMEAFQEGCPDLTLLMTFGHSYPWKQSEGGKKPLADCPYGLLAPFVDGMIASARGRTRLIDGYELSYGFRDPAKFATVYRTIKEDLRPIVGDPEAYGKVVSVGFGIWMDYDWRKYGWDLDDLTRNYYTPDAFEASVRKALEITDEYVWIYTEAPRWWSPEGKAIKLPPPYEAAIRRALGGVKRE